MFPFSSGWPLAVTKQVAWLMTPASIRQKPNTRSAIQTLPFQTIPPFGWLAPLVTSVPGEAKALPIQHSARMAIARALVRYFLRAFPGKTILLLGDRKGSQFMMVPLFT